MSRAKCNTKLRDNISLIPCKFTQFFIGYYNKSFQVWNENETIVCAICQRFLPKPYRTVGQLGFIFTKNEADVEVKFTRPRSW